MATVVATAVAVAVLATAGGARGMADTLVAVASAWVSDVVPVVSVASLIPSS
jgi:hypothetical protein